MRWSFLGPAGTHPSPARISRWEHGSEILLVSRATVLAFCPDPGLCVHTHMERRLFSAVVRWDYASRVIVV